MPVDVWLFRPQTGGISARTPFEDIEGASAEWRALRLRRRLVDEVVIG
jgi:hypothetical protein